MKRFLVGLILQEEDCVISPVEDAEFDTELDAMRKAKSISDLPFTWGSAYAVYDTKNNSVSMVCINGQAWIGHSEDYSISREEEGDESELE